MLLDRRCSADHPLDTSLAFEFDSLLCAVPALFRFVPNDVLTSARARSGPLVTTGLTLMTSPNGCDSQGCVLMTTV